MTIAELGRLSVTLTTLDPAAVIHQAVRTESRRAGERGVTLDLGQLFATLIENSVRDGGRIALGLKSQRDAWALVIDYSAPGVDVDLTQHCSSRSTARSPVTR